MENESKRNRDNPAQEGDTSQNKGEKPPEVLRTDLQIPQSVIEQREPRQNQNDGRECFKVFLEVLTMIGVLFYGAVAYYQLNATKQILEADTRPYVGAFPHTDYFGTKDANLGFAPGSPLLMSFRFYDYGKLPADAWVRSVVTYSLVRRSSAEPFPNIWRHFEIWPQQTNSDPLFQRDRAESLKPATDAVANSIRQGKGFIYFAIEIRYSGHLTLICKEYNVTNSRGLHDSTLPLPLPTLCQDAAANRAD